MIYEGIATYQDVHTPQEIKMTETMSNIIFERYIQELFRKMKD